MQAWGQDLGSWLVPHLVVSNPRRAGSVARHSPLSLVKPEIKAVPGHKTEEPQPQA